MWIFCTVLFTWPRLESIWNGTMALVDLFFAIFSSLANTLLKSFNGFCLVINERGIKTSLVSLKFSIMVGTNKVNESKKLQRNYFFFLDKF